MLNSFLALNELKCFNATSTRINDRIFELSSKVRDKFFEFYEEKQHLKEQFFIEELHRNWYRFDSKLDADDYLNRDKYIDRDLIELVKFLSHSAIELDCIEQLKTDEIAKIDFKYVEVRWSFYYDFDFIDEDAFLDYKLFNKLNVNPKLNLLIGGITDEKCDIHLKMMKEYPFDQFNAPIISKKDAQEIIKNMSILRTGNLCYFFKFKHQLIIISYII